MNKRRIVVGAVLTGVLIYLLFFPPHRGENAFVQREYFSLGTWVTLSAWLPDEMTREQGVAVLEEAESLLLDYQKTWSTKDNSTLARLNSEMEFAKTGEQVAIPEKLQALFKRAFSVFDLSAGAFDPRIGKLVKEWGFSSAEDFRSEPPDPYKITHLTRELKAAPRTLEPCASGKGLCYSAAEIAFDFGAIAKGEAADLVLELLKERGINNALLNLGGNLSGRGVRGNRDWHIAIRHPRDEVGKWLARLDLQDESVVTSGDYERYFDHNGKRFHHILNPKSGYPAQGLQSVTVVHKDGTLADAASTALFVAGDSGWREMAKKLDCPQVIVVLANGRVQVTQALASRITFPDYVLAETVP